MGAGPHERGVVEGVSKGLQGSEPFIVLLIVAGSSKFEYSVGITIIAAGPYATEATADAASVGAASSTSSSSSLRTSAS